MKKMLIMLAVATIPAIAGGCNCFGLGACPCNPCNWCNRGAYCAPAPVYAAAPCGPVAAPYGPVAAPAIMPQYAGPAAAPLAATMPMMGPPMMADPSAMGYTQAQPMYYSDPGCGYVEPGCAYPTAVGYGAAMPMMGGCETGCCDTGSYGGQSYSGGEVMTTPVEPFVEPQPVAE